MRLFKRMVASKVSILCGIVENVIFIRKLWDPGIPPMKKFSMLLLNLTRMHLTKQVTNTRRSSIQRWGRKLVKPSQEEETEVGRLLNSVPPFHLM